MSATRTFPEAAQLDPARPRRRLVACCLLDGGVRPSPLVEQAARSVLDLSVGSQRRLLDVWLDALGTIAWDVSTPIVRILHGGSAPAPGQRPEGTFHLEITKDTDSYRGPAGVVHDAMWDQPADTEFLVCEAGRYLTGGLSELLAHHRRGGADVTIARDASGSPAGVLVVARSTLDIVPDRGFVDLKEQWLGKLIATGATVLVHDLPVGYASPIRTRLDLLQAARIEARNPPDSGGMTLATIRAAARLARRAKPGWAVAPTATVSPSAVVARSIVMEGAVIGDDAVVSSSLVLPGAVVAPGRLVMDQVVT